MQKRFLFIILGFITGVIYVSACGSTSVTSSIAAAVTNAIDVVYSNTTSKLVATNVQAAIDEVNTKVASSESAASVSSLLAGTWVGKQYPATRKSVTSVEGTLVLNADGTYTCNDDSASSGDGFFGNQYSVCTGGNPDAKTNKTSLASWELIGNKLLQLSFLDDNDGSPETIRTVFPILSVNSTTLTLLPAVGDSSSGGIQNTKVLVLTKQ